MADSYAIEGIIPDVSGPNLPYQKACQKDSEANLKGLPLAKDLMPIKIKTIIHIKYTNIHVMMTLKEKQNANKTNSLLTFGGSQGNNSLF